MEGLNGKSWTMVLLVAGLSLLGCSERDNNESGEPPASGADLSGVIAVEARTRIDGDTADDFLTGTARSNDSEPQALISPVLAGGYLSSDSGTYDPSETPNNASFGFFADGRDQFQVRLTENQVVNVQAFTFNGVPFATGDSYGSLFLLRDGEQVDQDTIAAQGVASVSPPADVEEGQYTVSLQSAPNSGPFRYVLSVVADGSAPSTFHYGQPEFVPGEAIVTMEPQSGRAQAAVSTLGAARAESLGHGTWYLRQASARPQSKMSETEIDAAQDETLAWVRALKVAPGVKSAEPNYLVHAFAVNASNDPLFRNQWHYPLIGLPMAWQALSEPGRGVRVAVLDTGIFTSTPQQGGNWHPDLDDGNSTGANVSIISPIADFVTGEQDDDGDRGRDGNPADPGNGSPQTDNFHGSHVAGTIAALDNSIGGIGVAPQATLLPIRVLGQDGVGTANDLIVAINTLTDLPASQRPDIINLSLGLTVPVEPLENAIQRAVEAGIIVVAAAGNQGTSERVYPAAYSNVIGVGAVDAGRERASYSSFGDWLQLVAPGGDASRDGNNDGQADLIISPWGTIASGSYEPAYAGLQGTSMAAPHVSGVIALMKQQRDSLDLTEFLVFLNQGSLTDVTDDGGRSAEYGFGLINAVKAVSAATDGDLGNLLIPTPGSLQFEGSVLQASVDLQSFPEDGDQIDLDMVTVQSAPSWLDVTLESSPSAEGRNLTARILNEDAAEQAAVVLGYTNDRGSQTLDLPVNVQLGDAPENRDAGRHFVLLVGTGESSDTVAQVDVQPVNGRYSFAFDNVPSGDYFLVAGSDLDNNGFICESAEACAEYPTNGFPQPITVGDEPVNGLSITTSFLRPALESQGLPRIGFEGYRLLGNGARTGTSINTKSVAP